MRIVCAPDSFKHALTAVEAADAMARGVRAAVPDAVCLTVPLSDGGEGFTDAFAASLDARVLTTPVLDALGRPREGRFALTGELAAFEVATAVGLQDVADDERDVWASDSRGVGQVIAAALDAGARRFVVGLGGSATNDGGAGMLAALGVRLLDAAGAPVQPTPRGLRDLARVDVTGLDPRLADASFTVAADVDNPLLGERGASAVFGPQKGAAPHDVAALDTALTHWAALSGHAEGADRPGAGAAGGLGFAFAAFLGARLRPGIEMVAEASGLADAIADADLVLSGEGSLDGQTLAGKVPSGVAALAAHHGVGLVLFAGRVEPEADVLRERGVLDLVTITPPGTELPIALRDAGAHLEGAVADWLRRHGAPQ